MIKCIHKLLKKTFILRFQCRNKNRIGQIKPFCYMRILLSCHLMHHVKISEKFSLSVHSDSEAKCIKRFQLFGIVTSLYAQSCR